MYSTVLSIRTAALSTEQTQYMDGTKSSSSSRVESKRDDRPGPRLQFRLSEWQGWGEGSIIGPTQSGGGHSRPPRLPRLSRIGLSFLFLTLSTVMI